MSVCLYLGSPADEDTSGYGTPTCVNVFASLHFVNDALLLESQELSLGVDLLKLQLVSLLPRKLNGFELGPGTMLNCFGRQSNGLTGVQGFKTGLNC